jgi:hypothetical protein
MTYVHNLMYAIANLMDEGKVKQATALSMKLNAARGKRQQRGPQLQRHHR